MGLFTFNQGVPVSFFEPMPSPKCCRFLSVPKKGLNKAHSAPVQLADIQQPGSMLLISLHGAHIFYLDEVSFSGSVLQVGDEARQLIALVEEDVAVFPIFHQIVQSLRCFDLEPRGQPGFNLFFLIVS